MGNQISRKKKKEKKEIAKVWPKESPVVKNIDLRQPPRSKAELPSGKDVINDFETIPVIKDQYVINYNHILGSGAFGVVYGGRNKADGTKFAVKIVDKTKLDKVSVDAIANESIIVSRLDHPNIIKYYYITNNPKSMSIYMEYFTGGDLLNYINKYDYINECNSYKIFKQLTKAVRYLHDNDIIHRDIKLDNILFNRDDKDLRIVLTDFGLSVNRSKSDPLLTVACGSPYYIAPEMLEFEPRYDGYASDVWAMAVTLFAVTTGNYPFYCDKDYTQMHKREIIFGRIKNGDISYPQHISGSLYELLIGLFRRDPDDRYTLDDIKRSKWIKFWKDQIKQGNECLPNSPRGEASRVNMAAVHRTRSYGNVYDSHSETISLHQHDEDDELPSELGIPPSPPRSFALIPPPPDYDAPALPALSTQPVDDFHQAMMNYFNQPVSSKTKAKGGIYR